jgi:CBS domain-containing protein
MNVGTICSRYPVAASASCPLSEIASLMYERHVGAVVVTRSPSDRAVPVGIITDRDVIRAQLHRAADLSRLCAAEVMTRDPVTVCESDSIEEALRRLRARGVRRAPVLDSSGALRGIISADDVLVQLALQVASLGRLLERQAIHNVEPEMRP